MGGAQERGGGVADRYDRSRSGSSRSLSSFAVKVFLKRGRQEVVRLLALIERRADRREQTKA